MTGQKLLTSLQNLGILIEKSWNQSEEQVHL